MQFFKVPLQEQPYFRHQLCCASLLSVDMRDTCDVWRAGTVVGGLMEAGQPGGEAGL